jgi:signal transduction histidine kinase
MKLSEHPFIQSISENNRDAILNEIEVINLLPGEPIFSENSASDALYIILKGFVAFTKEKPDGSTQHISTSGEGSFFGEVGVLTGEARSLNASANTNCLIGRIPAHTVTKIISDAEPVKKVLESVINHLKRTTEQYIEEVTRKEKLSLVGTMVSSILHDFKNPFSIISLGAHLINQRHGSDPKTAKICANIESQIRRMVDMANDLTAFTRGEDSIEMAPTSTARIFEQFRELNQPFFEDPTVSVEIRGNDLPLHGDLNKLLRVLQNLVLNAIEAIHQTKQPGKIEIQAIDKETTIELHITDNGPGIPEEIQSRFFEPFITFGKSGGTGLGTAIVRSIIDAHKGNIIFSTSPTGTTFKIQLPKHT